ncbi:hypothetical protein MMC10_007021 [Thelotrema lepadinum]|nr:hypothetical protein [Thelotrema lepadinum]
MAWYSDEYIDSTVNLDYVSRNLSADGQKYLPKPLAFGHGLTDLTYGEWIVTRSPRLFLILHDIGSTERIFDLVDRSVDDSDMPFSSNDIATLGLANASQQKKFYSRQFAYKVRTLHKGDHIDYEENDVVPLDNVQRGKGLSSKGEKNGIGRFSTGQVELTRWRISLSAENESDKKDLVHYYKKLQELTHPNLTSIFATYTHQNQSYVLLTPSVEMSLESFLEEPPKDFKQMSRSSQLDLILQWIHCLAAAVTYLHQNGWAHQSIRPSNIFITGENRIVLGPYAAIGVLEDEDASHAKGLYEHGSPEQWQKQAPWANLAPIETHNRSVSADMVEHHRKPSLSSSVVERGNSRSNGSTIKHRHARSNSSNKVVCDRVQKGALRMSKSFPTDFQALKDPAKGALPSRQRQQSNPAASEYTNRSLFSTTASAPFQSDVFSLATVIVQLLSLFGSICHSSNRYSPSSARAHLSKGNRADKSFHANLPAVHQWLDRLVQVSESKNKKVPNIISRNLSSTRSNRTQKNDLDQSRYLGVMTSFVGITRHGIARLPDQRLSASSFLTQINESLRSWGISMSSCDCFDQEEQTASADHREESRSAVNLLNTESKVNAHQRKTSTSSASPEINLVTAETNYPESKIDLEYRLPALTYSPSPLTPTLHIPSRPPTPPPKNDIPALTPTKSKKPKPKLELLITGPDGELKGPQFLPPTPSSTLFHPTVYEMAASAWDSDAETAVHEPQDLDSPDLSLFEESDNALERMLSQLKAQSKLEDHNRQTEKRESMKEQNRNKHRTNTESVIIALDTFDLPTKQGKIIERSRTRKHLSACMKTVDKERIGGEDMVRDGELWWGQDWGKWKKGEHGWRPVVGAGRDQEKLAREYSRLRRAKKMGLVSA